MEAAKAKEPFVPSPLPTYCLPGVSEEVTSQAKEAAQVAKADWGPIFVYGSLLSDEAWAALIGRVPERKPAILRGYSRRAIESCGFAAIYPIEGELTIGQEVTGLQPWERRLMDLVIDDAFSLQKVDVKHLDNQDGDFVTCTAYVWKEDFIDALKEDDWNMVEFQMEHLADFCSMCRDVSERHRASILGDEELKELALRRRRRMQDDDDDDEDEDEEDNDEEDEG